MATSLKPGFAQTFSCCPKNLSRPKLGGAAAPLAPPARTPMIIIANNECLQEQQQQLYLYPAIPNIDLHDTKKLDKIIYRESVQAAIITIGAKKIGQPH